MDLKRGDQVNMVVERETPLGYLVIIEEKYEGLLHHSEVFAEIAPDMKLEGYVVKVREDDKIDISMRPQGFLNAIDNDVDRILAELHESPKGYLLLTDKSDPEAIRYHLNMSKKAYKKAIGHLYKEKLITITADKVELIEKSDEQLANSIRN